MKKKKENHFDVSLSSYEKWICGYTIQIFIPPWKILTTFVSRMKGYKYVILKSYTLSKSYNHSKTSEIMSFPVAQKFSSLGYGFMLR